MVPSWTRVKGKRSKGKSPLGEETDYSEAEHGNMGAIEEEEEEKTASGKLLEELDRNIAKEWVHLQAVLAAVRQASGDCAHVVSGLQEKKNKLNHLADLTDVEKKTQAQIEAQFPSKAHDLQSAVEDILKILTEAQNTLKSVGGDGENSD